MELAQGYRLQDERMTMELLYDITEIKQNDIYIYGAGMVAELLTVEIKNTSNILIHAYAVTQYPCGMDSINGIPVISVDHIPENAAVVIATLLDSHEEMRLSLERHHTGICYAVSEIMFRNMRKKCVSESVDKASKKLRLNEMRRLSETDWEGLIICDEMLPRFLGKPKNIEIISSGQFMEETDMACKYKRIFVLLIDWSGNWKELIHKLFTTQAEIILSYRYKYLRLTELNLIDEAKKQGFQLSGQKRFDRDRREFYTEDVLLRFQKRTSVTLRNDRLCTGCGKCTLECPAGALHMETDVYGYKKPTKVMAGKTIPIHPVEVLLAQDAENTILLITSSYKEEIIRQLEQLDGLEKLEYTDFLEIFDAAADLVSLRISLDAGNEEAFVATKGRRLFRQVVENIKRYREKTENLLLKLDGDVGYKNFARMLLEAF